MSSFSRNIGLDVGMRFPTCIGMTQQRSPFSSESHAGRPAIVILAGTLPVTAVMPFVEAFRQRLASVSERQTECLVLVNGLGRHALDYKIEEESGVALVYTTDDFFNHCGFQAFCPAVLVVNPGLRLGAVLDPRIESDVVSAAMRAVEALPVEAPRDIALPAPVLMIPDVLSGDLPGRLVRHFEASAHAAGGVASIDMTGAACHKIDLDKKRRQDCVIEPASPLCNEVLQALSLACLPEIKRAFQFDVGFVDRILVARYDDTGGYFRRHRDNTAPDVSYRQFALSVNLNSEDYEGGFLTFPEYNGHRYKPKTGAGIVFSASLLHEATPVTRGSRYVLLTFFHNREAETRRLAA